MTAGRPEVITTVQRRRRWSTAEKQRIVGASLERDAVASAVAREAGIHVCQLLRWRQRALPAGRSPSGNLCGRGGVGGASFAAGVIEIEFASGARLRITGAVDA